MLIPNMPERIPSINAKNILINLSVPKVNVLPENYGYDVYNSHVYNRYY